MICAGSPAGLIPHLSASKSMLSPYDVLYFTIEGEDLKMGLLYYFNNCIEIQFTYHKISLLKFMF